MLSGRADGRKQTPVRRPEWPPKHLRCLFGIQGRLEHPRRLESSYEVLIFEPRATRVGSRSVKITDTVRSPVKTSC